jgi:tetratricopeptide (TPR) repeat protein
MSYINEALKKAQEKKDSSYKEYMGIAESGGEAKRPPGIKAFIYSVSAIFLLFLIFSVFLWLHFSHDDEKQAPATQQPGVEETNKDSLDKKALNDKALGLYRAGRFNEAKNLYEAVVGLDPGSIDALNNLGIIYIREKNYNAAKECLEKALRLNPNYVESYYNLACLHAIRGDVDLGMEYLGKAILLDKKVIEWAKADSDLVNLKSSDKFKTMTSQ